MRRWTVPVDAATGGDVERLTVEADAEGNFQFAKIDAAPRLFLSPSKEGMVTLSDTDSFEAEP